MFAPASATALGATTALNQQASTSPFNKELEDLVIKLVKEVLVDVDAEEFILFIKLLAALPSMSTLAGRQELVNIIMLQSDLDKMFDVSCIVSYDQLQNYFKFSKKYFLDKFFKKSLKQTKKI